MIEVQHGLTQSINAFDTERDRSRGRAVPTTNTTMGREVIRPKKTGQKIFGWKTCLLYLLLLNKSLEVVGSVFTVGFLALFGNAKCRWKSAIWMICCYGGRESTTINYYKMKMKVIGIIGHSIQPT